MTEPRLKRFMCSYGFDREQWTFDIMAADHVDAQRRLAAIKSWGKLDGELVAEIKISEGWPEKLVKWFCGMRQP